MKKIFMIVALLCAPAHAATMCVPDLSTCESCTPVGTEDNMWVADCCGVRVKGYALLFQIGTWGDDTCVNVSQPIGESFFKFLDEYVIACLMISPNVPKYTYLVRPTDYGYQAYLQDCASAFKPKCAFSECTETICGELLGGGI